MTKKEINELKREVKRATGRNMKDIEEISMVSAAKIEFGYYKTNYDRSAAGTRETAEKLTSEE